MPKFEVKHLDFKVLNVTDPNTNTVVTKVKTNKQIQLYTNKAWPVGTTPGYITYFADVYEVTTTINLNLAGNRKVLDVWTRGNGSTLYNGPYGFEYLPEPILVSFDQKTAKVKGYLYYLIKDVTNGNTIINKWYPTSGNQSPLTGSSNFEITVYSEDASVSDKEVVSINPEYTRVVPNPSTGEFKLMFGLLKNTNMAIQVVDLLGRVVYQKPSEFELEGHKEISINLLNMQKGLYLCSIITSEGIVNKKIIIQ